CELMFWVVGLGFGVVAAYREGAAISVTQAFQNLNRAGFSRSVRAEQPKHFAFGDLKTDAANGMHVAVTLGEILYLQNGISHRRNTKFTAKPASLLATAVLVPVVTSYSWPPADTTKSLGQRFQRSAATAFSFPGFR